MTVMSSRFSDAVTTKQLCQIHPFMNENTLRWQRHIGEGPPSFKVGRKVLYSLSAVEEWLTALELATARGGIG